MALLSNTKYVDADQRINFFKKRFGNAHLSLAYHAALPLTITPDLLYSLWANFPLDVNEGSLNIPWIAVADLLLSGLCDEVGHELYEMDVTTRNILLTELENDSRLGPKRIQQLSYFLLSYVKDQLHNSNHNIRDFAQAQYITALAYIEPNTAARELALSINRAYQQDKFETIRVASIVETLERPLAEFKPLLIYARGIASWLLRDLDTVVTEFSKLRKWNYHIQVAGIDLIVPEEILKATRLKSTSGKIIELEVVNKNFLNLQLLTSTLKDPFIDESSEEKVSSIDYETSFSFSNNRLVAN